ncbi:hypothetical protein F5Y11DRAFT_309673 [Daldinia sp. FL1419]|nr:hypothetical protein F5Y11DRAFT_309673 [Daldinia sp. FL1419]
MLVLSAPFFCSVSCATTGIFVHGSRRCPHLENEWSFDFIRHIPVRAVFSLIPGALKYSVCTIYSNLEDIITPTRPGVSPALICGWDCLLE